MLAQFRSRFWRRFQEIAIRMFRIRKIDIFSMLSVLMVSLYFVWLRIMSDVISLSFFIFVVVWILGVLLIDFVMLLSLIVFWLGFLGWWWLIIVIIVVMNCVEIGWWGKLWIMIVQLNLSDLLHKLYFLNPEIVV